MLLLPKQRKLDSVDWSIILVGIFPLAYLAAAWVTHVVVCIKTSSWGFLIAGAIFFPVGVAHGTLSWFGY